MLAKALLSLPLLALANAAAVERRGQTDVCTDFQSWISYFGTATASAKSFCSPYLTASTTTKTTVVTATAPGPTVTVSSTSTYVESDTTTTTATATVTTTPTTTITTTKTCTVAPEATGNSKRSAASSQTYNCQPASARGAVCGVGGLLSFPATFAITSQQTFEQCRDSCVGNQQCLSFSYLQYNGLCTLFRKSISSQGLAWNSQSAQGALMHYDQGCFTCTPASGNGGGYSTPTQVPPSATSFVSSACSCIFGQTTPCATATSTTTTTGAPVTTSQIIVVTLTTYVSTVTTTVTSTSTAPAQVSTATRTIPNTLSGTYTNTYGDLYDEFQYTDFYGGDLMNGGCYQGGSGFNVNGTLVPCSDFYGCQDVCSYVNRNGYSCAGVAYHPNPMAGGYSTCYLKSTVPDGNPYCGQASSHPEVDSAELISMGTGTGPSTSS